MKIRNIIVMVILLIGLLGCSNGGYTQTEEQAKLEKSYGLQLKYLQTIQTEDGEKHQYQTLDDQQIVFEAYSEYPPGLVANLMAAAFQQNTGVVKDNYRERLMVEIGTQYINDQQLENCKINEDGNFEILYSSYDELEQAWSSYMIFINDIKSNELIHGKIKTMFAPIYLNSRIHNAYTNKHYLSNLPIPTDDGFNEDKTKTSMIETYIYLLEDLGIDDETVPTQLIAAIEKKYTFQEEWKMNGETIALSRRISDNSWNISFGNFYHLLQGLGFEVTGDIYDYTFSLKDHKYRISYQFFEDGSSYYLEDNKKIYGRDNQHLQEESYTVDYSVFFPDLSYERVEK